MVRIPKRLLILSLIWSGLWGIFSQSVNAQVGVEILETNVSYTFGGQATFWARFQSEISPESVQVFYRSRGDEETRMGEALVFQDEVQYTLDLASQPFKAFSEVEYYFAFNLPLETVVSPTFSFYYEDNRFDWRTLQDGSFRVHWYEGDQAFGQMVLDVARAGLQKAQTLLMFPEPEKVEIFVYASGAEMQSTLQLGGIRLISGHASPELGVMMVSLPPGPDQRMETERQVPHELMHILLYQRFGMGFYKMPVWLNEGLASLNEMLANPDYYTLLKFASERGTLLPMKSLCNSFPSDASYYYQSYAQADSFVRFIYSEYGTTGLEALLVNFTNGLDCERGTEKALGISLEQLERRWMARSLNQNLFLKALKLIAPWAAILAVSLFAPVFLSLSNLSSKEKRHS